MKKTFIIGGALMLSAALFSFTAIQTSWNLDAAHSNLRFVTTHMGVTEVEGCFTKFDAKVISSSENLSDAVITMHGDAASINTFNDYRDKDLKSEAFFNVEKYPSFEFKSTGVSKADENNYKISGDLTMHGVTKSVVLLGQARYGKNLMSQKEIVGLKITGTIKRSDFGIGDKLPTAVVADEINIVANGEYVKQTDADKK